MTIKHIVKALAVASTLWLGAASTAYAQKPIELEDVKGQVRGHDQASQSLRAQNGR